MFYVLNAFWLPWLRECPQNFTFALEASLLGQMFIFRTISQPRTLSADIPAAGRGLFTNYTMIYKDGERMRDFLDLSIFILV